MEPIRRFGIDAYTAALESWAWAGHLDGMAPLMASAFGDVFLQAEDGTFWFLDVHEGTFQQRWEDADALQADINTPDAQGQYLMAGLLGAAVHAGIVPGAEEILAFKVPPVVGGEVSVDNLEVSDFVVTVNLLGQIHEQVKDLPPGTPIAGFTVADD